MFNTWNSKKYLNDHVVSPFQTNGKRSENFYPIWKHQRQDHLNPFASKQCSYVYDGEVFQQWILPSSSCFLFNLPLIQQFGCSTKILITTDLAYVGQRRDAHGSICAEQRIPAHRSAWEGAALSGRSPVVSTSHHQDCWHGAGETSHTAHTASWARRG